MSGKGHRAYTSCAHCGQGWPCESMRREAVEDALEHLRRMHANWDTWNRDQLWHELRMAQVDLERATQP